MTHQTVEATALLNRTVLNWHNARDIFSAFIAAHPELGMRDSPITFRNFCYRHGRQLRELDVMRKPSGLRASAIFDADRFDEVAFNILSLRYQCPTSALPSLSTITQPEDRGRLGIEAFHEA